ncbi:helicase associated domain-containing protein [Nakamurella alba]
MWEQRLAELVQFAADAGRWPRATGKAPIAERRLGQWLTTQRRELRGCALTEHRRRRLDQQLPQWHTAGVITPAPPAPHPHAAP